MSKKLLKAGVIVSAMTFLSRVLGLVRDIIVANIMGAGLASDIFFFANKIPNFLRRLFAEGAFAQAFIPVLTEVHAKNNTQELREFAAKVSGTLGIIVFITAVIGVIGSPIIAALFGTGWFIDYLNDHPDGEKFILSAEMLKITFPYIFFISLTGFAGATLNTLNKFAVSSFTPVLLNVCIIACAIYLVPYLDNAAFALAWGVFIGGAVQLLFQLPFLYRAGLLVKPQWGWRDPNVVKVRTLMIPALFGVSVSQINLLLDTMIASFLVTNSISWLYYSDRLLEFPLGLFGIAIATVILPTLSRNHVGNDNMSFSSNMDWAIKMVCLLGIPASAALVILAYPMMNVMFQRGEFTNDDATMASYSLMAYGAGLLSFMIVKVLAPGYYSRQDTKTPVKYGIITMVANMVFNLILVFPFGYVGLAVATTISGSLNALLLYVTLHKKGVYSLSRDSVFFIGKIIVATAVMVAVILYMKLDMQWVSVSLSTRILSLTTLIIGGGSVYLLALLLLGVRLRNIKNAAVNKIIPN